MHPCHRLLAITATAFALGACNTSGDEATLRISLGSVLQALTVEAVSIDRYELTVTCADGSETTHTGAIADDGSFSAEVPNCPRANIRFRGLTSNRMPALDGSVVAAIRAPATDVTLPVRRVGTVTIVNDDAFTSVCKVSVANAPQYDAVFELASGASRVDVLPVNGTELSCAPAETCGSAATCDLSGPLATTRGVAVDFGGHSTLSIKSLTHRLVFTVSPVSLLLAGAPWASFTVGLVDAAGQTVSRSDVSVDLVAESSVAHGGFQNGSQGMVDGAASFSSVSFTTAGALSMRATAAVDGLVLRTDVLTLTIVPDAVALLQLVGPVTAIAGVPIAIVINGVDRFGNSTNAPASVVLDSTDVQALGQVLESVAQSQTLPLASASTMLELRTAGRQTITARSAEDPSVVGSLAVDVVAGATAGLSVSSSAARIIPTQPVTLTVRAQDAWGNAVPTYAGNVTLGFSPAGNVTYSGPHTFGAADAGVHGFTARFDTVGIRSVQATDGTLSSPLVSVSVIGATELARVLVAAPVLPVRAGEDVSVTLTALNAAGEVIESFWDAVELRSDGCYPAELSFYGSSGVITQDIQCRIAGSWILTAYHADVEVGASGVPLTVIAGTPYRLQLAQDAPGTVLAGQPFYAAFRLEDINGNTANPAEHAAPIVLQLSDAGNTLGGTTPVIVNGILTYPALTIAVFSGEMQITASTSGLEVNSASTSYFVVSQGTGCPVAYVRPGGQGDGCSPTTAAGTISAALSRVDDGGKVLVAAGTYGEQVLIGKSVALRGGYDIGFGEVTRNPLAMTKIKPTVVDTSSAVETTSNATVTIDGFFIAAADPSGFQSVTRAVSLDGGASVTLENNRIIGPVFDAPVAEAAAIAIGATTSVTIRNNWIHSGGGRAGRPSGARRTILAGSSSGEAPTVHIVHNTFYVADADMSEALFYQGFGDYRLTNNLIVGNFGDCGSDAGVCAVREMGSNGVSSMQNNYVLQLNGSSPAAYVYVDYTGFPFTSLNQFGGPAFAGNVSQVNGLPQAAFVRFTGLFETDDWHLVAQGPFGVARDAALWTCGFSANLACGGNGRDIDGQVRTAPICVGADEQDLILLR